MFEAKEKRVSIYIEPKLWDRVRGEALIKKEQYPTVTDAVDEALRDWLKKISG